MSTEELLKPRYKVVAMYPGMNFDYGEIIVLDKVDGDDRFYKGTYYCYHNGNGATAEYELKEYPAIFKPLQWWEEREEKDMPKYLKSEDEIIKVSIWAFDTVRPVMYFTWDGDNVGAYIDYPPYYTPATESEYNEYLKRSK